MKSKRRPTGYYSARTRSENQHKLSSIHIGLSFFTLHYHLPIDRWELSYSIWEERLKQVRVIDGEIAYDWMRRALERARQPLSHTQFPSREAEAPWDRTRLQFQPQPLRGAHYESRIVLHLRAPSRSGQLPRVSIIDEFDYV